MNYSEIEFGVNIIIINFDKLQFESALNIFILILIKFCLFIFLKWCNRCQILFIKLNLLTLIY